MSKNQKMVLTSVSIKRIHEEVKERLELEEPMTLTELTEQLQRLLDAKTAQKQG